MASFFGSLINSLTHDSPLRYDQSLHDVGKGRFHWPQTISSKVPAPVDKDRSFELSHVVSQIQARIRLPLSAT